MDGRIEGDWLLGCPFLELASFLELFKRRLKGHFFLLGCRECFLFSPVAREESDLTFDLPLLGPFVVLAPKGDHLYSWAF